jgi:UDP-2-acetamido-3-amino-2,3-dideoxy-glucuronate N-acetyltransferase
MENNFIHKTAEIEVGAEIGTGIHVWQNCQIKSGAKIGNDCTIGHNCFVGGKAKIGNGVKIQSNTDVWDFIELSDYVFVGPSVVFTNDPNPRAKYPKSKYPEFGSWKPTIVKEGATLGANSTIICDITIGKWAFIGAGAVVNKNVNDYALVVGVPARQVGWVCECGNKLNINDNLSRCEVCKKEYKLENEELCRTK